MLAQILRIPENARSITHTRKVHHTKVLAALGYRLHKLPPAPAHDVQDVNILRGLA